MMASSAAPSAPSLLAIFALFILGGVSLVSAGATADVAFYDGGLDCQDFPLYTANNITAESCHSISGLGLFVKCESDFSWVAYVFSSFESCYYGTADAQFINSDGFFYGSGKDNCASGHHGSLSPSSPSYNMKVSCRYEQSHTDGHIAFQVFSNPSLHVGCNNKPIAETQYSKNGDCLSDLFNDISFNVTCDAVDSAFSGWELKVFDSPHCDSSLQPYTITGFGTNCTSLKVPHLNLDSLLHTRVFCDRGVIPVDPFVMSWGIFMYEGDDKSKAACDPEDDDNYNVIVDNSHNGECLTGLQWKTDSGSHKNVSVRVSCAGNYKGAPWYMHAYESDYCGQGPIIDSIYSGMSINTTCQHAQESSYMHAEVNCGGPVQQYVNWQGYNETYNGEGHCEGEPALIDNQYLTGDCSIHYFGTQEYYYGFRGYCLYRENGWVMEIWNNTKCQGKPFGYVQYPSHGEPTGKHTGFGGIGCNYGHFEDYLGHIDISMNCTGPKATTKHYHPGRIAWSLWFEDEPDASVANCPVGSEKTMVPYSTNALCYNHTYNNSHGEETPYSVLINCKDDSRYSIWTLELWDGVRNCSGIPSGIIKGYDATCTKSQTYSGFQATVKCDGPKEPVHSVYNWKLWLNKECKGAPTVYQNAYNNTACYTFNATENGKQVSYSHQVYCETTEKDSPWAMYIYESDSCSGESDDKIVNMGGGDVCVPSSKYNASAQVDCSKRGDWTASWKLWVDEPNSDNNETEHCEGPHLSNYFYNANDCQNLNFTRLFSGFNAQSYRIECVSQNPDSGYTVSFYEAFACLGGVTEAVHYGGYGDPTCMGNAHFPHGDSGHHEYHEFNFHMDVNCSATLPNVSKSDSVVEYKLGAKIPNGKSGGDICGATTTIAEGEVAMGECKSDPGTEGQYSVKAYCEEASAKSNWVLLLYEGGDCEGNPATVFEGGGDKKHKCGFSLLGDTLNTAQVFCKPKKKGSKGLGAGIDAAIGIGAILGLILLLALVFFGAKKYRNRKEQYDSETVYRPLTTPIAEMPMGSKS